MKTKQISEEISNNVKNLVWIKKILIFLLLENFKQFNSLWQSVLMYILYHAPLQCISCFMKGICRCMYIIIFQLVRENTLKHNLLKKSIKCYVVFNTYLLLYFLYSFIFLHIVNLHTELCFMSLAQSGTIHILLIIGYITFWHLTRNDPCLLCLSPMWKNSRKLTSLATSGGCCESIRGPYCVFV